MYVDLHGNKYNFLACAGRDFQVLKKLFNLVKAKAHFLRESTPLLDPDEKTWLLLIAWFYDKSHLTSLT